MTPFEIYYLLALGTMLGTVVSFLSDLFNLDFRNEKSSKDLAFNFLLRIVCCILWPLVVLSLPYLIYVAHRA